MHCIEWWHFRWSCVILTLKTPLISAFCVAFCIIIVGERRDFRFGVQVDHGSSSLWTTNCAWKGSGHGHVTSLNFGKYYYNHFTALYVLSAKYSMISQKWCKIDTWLQWKTVLDGDVTRGHCQEVIFICCLSNGSNMNDCMSLKVIPYCKPLQVQYFVFMARQAVHLHLQNFLSSFCWLWSIIDTVGCEIYCSVLCVNRFELFCSLLTRNLMGDNYLVRMPWEPLALHCLVENMQRYCNLRHFSIAINFREATAPKR